MRSIIFYLTIALFSNCGGQFPEKFMNQKQIEIQYEALSRGFFENILIIKLIVCWLSTERNEARHIRSDWIVCEIFHFGNESREWSRAVENWSRLLFITMRLRTKCLTSISSLFFILSR